MSRRNDAVQIRMGGLGQILLQFAVEIILNEILLDLVEVDPVDQVACGAAAGGGKEEPGGILTVRHRIAAGVILPVIGVALEFPHGVGSAVIAHADSVGLKAFDQGVDLGLIGHVLGVLGGGNDQIHHVSTGALAAPVSEGPGQRSPGGRQHVLVQGAHLLRVQLRKLSAVVGLVSVDQIGISFRVVAQLHVHSQIGAAARGRRPPEQLPGAVGKGIAGSRGDLRVFKAAVQHVLAVFHPVSSGAQYVSVLVIGRAGIELQAQDVVSFGILFLGDAAGVNGHVDAAVLQHRVGVNDALASVAFGRIAALVIGMVKFLGPNIVIRHGVGCRIPPNRL